MVRSLVLNPIYLVLMLQRLTIEIPQAQPTILEDGRVRFELHAPGAGKVLLNGLGQSESLPMKRDSMGNWEVTLGPLLPDLYSYSFLVDGALTVDPQNPEVKKNGEPSVHCSRSQDLIQTPCMPGEMYPMVRSIVIFTILRLQGGNVRCWSTPLLHTSWNLNPTFQSCICFMALVMTRRLGLKSAEVILFRITCSAKTGAKG